jgi:hypothetical protein
MFIDSARRLQLGVAATPHAQGHHGSIHSLSAPPQRHSAPAECPPGALSAVGACYDIPGANATQNADRALRQRDLAAIEGGGGEIGLRLFFDHAYLEAGAGQRAGKSEPDGATAHDNHVEFHPISLLGLLLPPAGLTQPSYGYT